MTTITKPTNYLTNRDVLENIHLSKSSYTWYIDDKPKKSSYLNYDIILCDPQTYNESRNQLMLQKINAKLLKDNKKKTSSLKDSLLHILDEEDYEDIKNKILLFDGEITDELLKKAKLGYHNRRLYEAGKKRVSELTQEEEDAIDEKDIVYRVFTFEHIPFDENIKNKEKAKKVADLKCKVNFPPYKHYAFHEGKFQCVAMSHHDSEGKFNTKHGNINYGLSKAFLMLCRKYAGRYNWRGYSYSEDMQGQALVQLTMVGLQFNELFSSNPFSYYTSTVKNAFTIIFNQEKRAQTIRDDLLVEYNQSPSWTKQLETDLARTEHWDSILDNNNLDNGDVREYNDEDMKEYEREHQDDYTNDPDVLNEPEDVETENQDEEYEEYDYDDSEKN